jgi:hypothetical protein
MFHSNRFVTVLNLILVFLLSSCAWPGTVYKPDEAAPPAIQALEGTNITDQVVWGPAHAELANLVKKVTVHPLMIHGLFMPVVKLRIDLELKDGCTTQSEAGNFTVTCDGGDTTISFSNDGPLMLALMGKPFYQPLSWQSESQIRYVKGGIK